LIDASSGCLHVDFKPLCHYDAVLQVLVNKRAGRGVSSPIGGRVSPMKQQAEAAGSSKKEASASAAATTRVSLTS